MQNLKHLRYAFGKNVFRLKPCLHYAYLLNILLLACLQKENRKDTKCAYWSIYMTRTLNCKSKEPWFFVCSTNHPGWLQISCILLRCLDSYMSRQNAYRICLDQIRTWLWLSVILIPYRSFFFTSITCISSRRPEFELRIWALVLRCVSKNKNFVIWLIHSWEIGLQSQIFNI